MPRQSVDPWYTVLSTAVIYRYRLGEYSNRYRYSQNPAYGTNTRYQFFLVVPKYIEKTSHKILKKFSRSAQIYRVKFSRSAQIYRGKFSRSMIPIPGSYRYHTDSVDPRYTVRKLLGLSTLPYALGADIRQAVRCLHWSVAMPRPIYRYRNIGIG